MVAGVEVAEQGAAAGLLALLSSAVEAAANAVVITDPTGQILWVNPAFTRMTGYSFQEAVGRNPRLLKSGLQDEAFYRSLWTTIAAGRVWEGEMINRRKDGVLYAAEMTITPVRNDKGRIAHFVAIQQDVTAQKHAEEALRAEHDRLQQYLDIAGTAILVVEADERVGLINRKGCELLGLPAHDVTGRYWFDAFLPERDRERWREVFRRAIEDGAEFPEYAECTVLRADGQERLVAWHSTVAVDPLRNTVELLCSGQDITESRQVQRALEESEERFRAVIATARDAIVMMGPDGRVTLWSPGAERLFGWTAEEAGGRVLHDLVCPPCLREAYARALPLFQAEGRGSAVGKTLELPALRKDGQEILVELSLSSLRLGGQWYAVGIVRDATARKQAEQARHREHTQTKQILSAIPSVLISLDGQESVVQWNASAEQVFSLPSRDALGRRFRECRISWDWTPVLDAIAATRADRKQHRVDDLRFTRSDGTSGFLGITVNPGHRRGGRVRRVPAGRRRHHGAQGPAGAADAGAATGVHRQPGGGHRP